MRTKLCCFSLSQISLGRIFLINLSLKKHVELSIYKFNYIDKYFILHLNQLICKNSYLSNLGYFCFTIKKKKFSTKLKLKQKHDSK
jgi:hypothetical protein